VLFESTPDLRREPMRQVVYDFLRKAIINGTLPPESTFKDQEIADEMGISRMPVREAVQRLEAEGYIERIPMKGNRVISISPFELAHAYAIRKALESLAVRYTAIRINDEELAALGGLVGKMEILFREKAGDDLVKAYLPIIKDYNVIMFTACRSVHLAELIWSQREVFDRYRVMRITLPSRIDISFANRKKLYETFLSHDPDAAAAVMEKHIENSFRVWLEKSGYKEELKDFELF
jgi:DNA-binding GntR family transcriptional regulator